MSEWRWRWYFSTNHVLCWFLAMLYVFCCDSASSGSGSFVFPKGEAFSSVNVFGNLSECSGRWVRSGRLCEFMFHSFTVLILHGLEFLQRVCKNVDSNRGFDLCRLVKL